MRQLMAWRGSLPSCAPARMAGSDAFFRNILIGAADISDSPMHRDALPQGKRYNLARRSNELYADG